MEHTKVHGHEIKYDLKDKEEIKKALVHLSAMSFESAERVFEHAKSIHRTDFSAGSHTFTLVAETHNYRLELKH